jgi:hypothetical protein
MKAFNDLSIGDYFQYEHVPGRLYRKRSKGTAVIVGAPCEETGRTWVRFPKDTNVQLVQHK